MQVMTNFFDLPPPCTHICAFSLTPPLSTIIYVQYKFNFHIKIYVTVFYIQIWFKCEPQLLFFQIKTMVYRKKHFIEKIWKSYQITCLTHMTLHAMWGDEITRVLISIKTRFGARFTNSSYKTELWKMTSHLWKMTSLTQKFLHRFLFLSY